MIDRISSLPDGVVSQGILNRLELSDAVRTSVLSRSWRYKWTLIPDLKLDMMFGRFIVDREVNTPSEYVNLVKSILMQHAGPLNSVELSFPPLGFPIGAFDFAIQFLLGRGVRALQVFGFGPRFVPLPCYFPSCSFLESLVVYGCRFSPPSGFAGCPNLKSLVLVSVQCNANRLSEFINCCSKLEKLVVHCLDYMDASRLCIRAPNLRRLEFYDFEMLQLLEVPGIVELNPCLNRPSNYGKLDLCGCLAQLECLKLGGNVIQSLLADGVTRELSSGLLGLKTLTAYDIDIHDSIVFSCLLSLIASSPCLHRLNVSLYKDADVLKEENFGSELAKHADRCFSNLTHVKISFIVGSETELRLIEFLLARSPVLEELSFKYLRKIEFDEGQTIYRELMGFRRASPNAEVKYL